VTSQHAPPMAATKSVTAALASMSCEGCGVCASCHVSAHAEKQSTRRRRPRRGRARAPLKPSARARRRAGARAQSEPPRSGAALLRGPALRLPRGPVLPARVPAPQARAPLAARACAGAPGHARAAHSRAREERRGTPPQRRQAASPTSAFSPACLHTRARTSSVAPRQRCARSDCTPPSAWRCCARSRRAASQVRALRRAAGREHAGDASRVPRRPLRAHALTPERSSSARGLLRCAVRTPWHRCLVGGCLPHLRPPTDAGQRRSGRDRRSACAPKTPAAAGTRRVRKLGRRSAWDLAGGAARRLLTAELAPRAAAPCK
jgi:hypothetical protein